jgi:hypothetical protein
MTPWWKPRTAPPSVLVLFRTLEVAALFRSTPAHVLKLAVVGTAPSLSGGFLDGILETPLQIQQNDVVVVETRRRSLVGPWILTGMGIGSLVIGSVLIGIGISAAW